MRRHVGRAAAVLAAAAAGILAMPAPPVAHAVAHAVAAPGTTCRLTRHGSTAVATCHNPDPTVTLVQLHVTCARWWDPATDTTPTTVGAAQWVTLTGRCWKEIHAVWISRGEDRP